MSQKKKIHNTVLTNFFARKTANYIVHIKLTSKQKVKPRVVMHLHEPARLFHMTKIPQETGKRKEHHISYRPPSAKAAREMA